jgi:hypothetical protein
VTTRVTPFDFKNSCFAEGTKVLTADGAYAPIETISVGDRVVAGEGGARLTVTSTGLGGESRPMVRLQDDKGHDILVTATHPVITASGVMVAAERLREGDQVKTESGVSTLIGVGREVYSGRVYNLAIGTTAELTVAGGSQGRTVFANGFLMGDQNMQDALVKTEPTADVLSKLPAAWHKDYLNATTSRP